MAKVFALELTFEEVPLLWGKTLSSIMVSGAIEVSYYATREWWVSDVWIDAVDCRKRINLRPDYEMDLRNMIIDSAVAKLNGRIERLVHESIDYEHGHMEAA